MIYFQLGKVTGVESSVISKCKQGVIFRVTLDPGEVSRETRPVKESKLDFSKLMLSLPFQAREPYDSVSAQLIGIAKAREITIGTADLPLTLCPPRCYVRDSFTFAGKGRHGAGATGVLSIHVSSDGAAAFSCPKVPVNPVIFEEWREQRSSRHGRRSKRSESYSAAPADAPPMLPTRQEGPLNPIESIPFCVLESVEAAFATAPDQALEFFSDIQFIKGGLEYFRVTGLEEHFRA
jgi:hypothetical protein